MLDIRRVRLHTDEVKEALAKRGEDYPIDEVISLDEKRRAMLTEVEQKKAEQNRVSKEIPALKQKGEDIDNLLEEMKALSDEIGQMDKEVRDVEASIKKILLEIPNTPAEEVEQGETDEDNVEIRVVGEPRDFDFEPKAHWDLGVDLDILDFERATKVSGTRFSIFKKEGAKLERAIIHYMLEIHTSEHGYEEYLTPVLANRDSMTGTGQLPKFEHDMFHVDSKDLFLIPTAEVTLTNLRRDEILQAEDLPQLYTGYTPCFRAEAGSAGRDTRGLVRNHQFDKVELVKLCKPEDSYDELEKLTADAEVILKNLGLPYRVVMLCTGDLGFSSAKTYDLEVWMPSYGRYVEISSCSNFEAYQARRTNLRFRNEEGKVEFLHTLNGSGLAVGRTFAAILENYQREDGSVEIPEALQAYMGIEVIE